MIVLSTWVIKDFGDWIIKTDVYVAGLWFLVWRTTFCSCFRHVSAKGNKCFRNRNSEFTFAETPENVAEICLFHVSADVFQTIATECVMEPAETQETTWKLMSVLCSRYWLATRHFKIILHLREVNLFCSLASWNAPLLFIICMAGGDSA